MSRSKKPSTDRPDPIERKPPIERPEKWIRLACLECDRSDFDGISEAHLELLRPLWGEITEEQSYEESITIWEDWQCIQWGKSNADWWTHIGTCPDCLADDLIGEPLDLSRAIILDLRPRQ